MDTAQWPQEIVVKPLEEIVVTNNTCPKPGGGGGGNLERKAIRPQKEQALNCPRCNSTNTKFCYYNNYSLTQPRYFCKTCRRYWTEGGSLRNIPVGGGSRKNKRSSTSNSSSSTSSSSLSKTTRLPDLVQPVHNPKIINQAQDLNLAFPSSAPNTTTHHHQHQHQHHQDFRNISDLIHQLPSNIDKNHSTSAATTTTTSTSHLSAMELLTGLTSRGFNSFMPMPVVPDPNTSVYASGLNFPLQVDFKPTLNFSLDGLGSSGGYASLQGVHEETNGSRLLFPFEDLKQVSSTTTTTGIIEQNKEQADHHQSTGGYWSGMLGGGSW